MENQTKQYEEELEIDLIDYFRIIWRHRKPIFAIFILAIILAVIISFIQPKVYQSSSLIRPAKIVPLKIENETLTKNIGLVIENSQMINLFKQESILKELAKKLNLPIFKISTLKKQFKITESDGLLEIVGRGNTPEKAKEITEVISEMVVKYENNLILPFKRSLENEINLLKDELNKNAFTISDLEKKIESSLKINSQAQALITASYISALEAAKSRRDELNKELYEKERKLNFQVQEAKIEALPFLPDRAIQPNKKMNIIIGALSGLIIGIFYAFLDEFLKKNKEKIVI